MTIVITGYTSQIAAELLGLVAERSVQADVRKCGRAAESDYHVDFSSVDQTRAFIDWLRSTRPNYLFLNHGILPGQRLLETAERTIDEALRINLISLLMVIEALPELANLSTVVTSSISGKAGSFDTLYAACKAGVSLAIKQTAPRLPVTSRLNAVSPGIIEDARMTTDRTDIQILDAKRDQTPTRRFTTSREVARLVAFLLFEPGNIQGEDFNINGGLYIP